MDKHVEVGSPYRVRLIAIALGLGLAGCLEEPSSEIAGLAVIWEIDRTPLVVLGSSPGVEFGRISDAVFLDESRLLVADEIDATIRLFSVPEGDLIHTFGGKGEGPGEFRDPSKLSRYRGDSIAVMDFYRQHTSIFDSEGRYGRTINLRSDNGRRIYPPEPLSNGRFVVWSPELKPREVGVDSAAVVLTTPEGVDLDTLDRVPVALNRYAESRPVNNPEEPRFIDPRGVVVAMDSAILIGWSESYHLRLIDQAGSMIREFRRDWEPSPISESEEAAWNRERRKVFSRSAIDVDWQDEDLEGTLPAFTGYVFLDPAGYLWVERYNFGPKDIERFDVFDTEGSWRGQVDLPEGLHLHSIIGDMVMGTSTDDLDVDRLLIYQIAR